MTARHQLSIRGLRTAMLPVGKLVEGECHRPSSAVGIAVPKQPGVLSYPGITRVCRRAL
jgi:hypothetical protein